MAGVATRAIYLRLGESDAKLLDERASAKGMSLPQFVRQTISAHLTAEEPAEDGLALRHPDSPKPDMTETELTVDDAATILKVAPWALIALVKAAAFLGLSFGSEWWLSHGAVVTELSELPR
jgi:hypothetical protein